jgi:methionyl-tRNA formyltransferase
MRSDDLPPASGVTIVALCESLSAATRMWRGLSGMPDVDLRLLVFGAGLLAQARRTPLHEWRLAARLLAARKLVATRRGLDHRLTLARLHALRPEIGLLVSRAIVRQPLIGCFSRGILTLHLGLLPAARGRAALEWSLIEGRPAGVSVFFVDAGIDTGHEIVLRREIAPEPGQGLAAAKRRLLARDAEFFRDAIERLRAPGNRPESHDGPGRRHYAMSRLLTGVAEQRARENVEYAAGS